MKKYIIVTITLGFMIVLTSCSFVSLDPQARSVNVSSSDVNALNKCKFLGNTNVSLWAKATTFQSQETIEDQLNTLARNEAVKMDGNVVIPDSAITNGQRSYRVYYCATQDKM